MSDSKKTLTALQDYDDTTEYANIPKYQVKCQ